MPNLGADPDYRAGRAGIPPRRPDPTEPIEPSGRWRRRPMPLRVRLRSLRSGGNWTTAGLVALFVCWALWAAEAGVANLAGSALVLVLIIGIAVGLFAVARLVGHLILERLMNRTRRSALLSHMAIGLFLAATGFSLLGQVEWVVTAFNRLSGQ